MKINFSLFEFIHLFSLIKNQIQIQKSRFCHSSSFSLFLDCFILINVLETFEELRKEIFEEFKTFLKALVENLQLKLAEALSEVIRIFVEKVVKQFHLKKNVNTETIFLQTLFMV
ncbi:hypothetical protein BpHYR1_005435 [Brachionus plicatilis]|uniref:Uncharacterized protein n=1 Tax=Brachionus plicatilis TaxID=10195 RepID=A0A3M7Q2T9_BRAPC|nr:hypothetical protein BpHYR1_005435 [Brachionus plicatilis]